MLTTGDYFMKHVRHGRPHQRFIWLNEVRREFLFATSLAELTFPIPCRI